MKLFTVKMMLNFNYSQIAGGPLRGRDNGVTLARKGGRWESSSILRPTIWSNMALWKVGILAKRYAIRESGSIPSKYTRITNEFYL